MSDRDDHALSATREQLVFERHGQTHRRDDRKLQTSVSIETSCTTQIVYSHVETYDAQALAGFTGATIRTYHTPLSNLSGSK